MEDPSANEIKPEAAADVDIIDVTGQSSADGLKSED